MESAVAIMNLSKKLKSTEIRQSQLIENSLKESLFLNLLFKALFENENSEFPSCLGKLIFGYIPMNSGKNLQFIKHSQLRFWYIYFPRLILEYYIQYIKNEYRELFNHQYFCCFTNYWPSTFFDSRIIRAYEFKNPRLAFNGNGIKNVMKSKYCQKLKYYDSELYDNEFKSGWYIGFQATDQKMFGKDDTDRYWNLAHTLIFQGFESINYRQMCFSFELIDSDDIVLSGLIFYPKKTIEENNANFRDICVTNLELFFPMSYFWKSKSYIKSIENIGTLKSFKVDHHPFNINIHKLRMSKSMI